ncbi:hypothetical protein [Sporosarcina sp. G11-34]|nr:hypothetical protein [Sporosarcina sp. G11-34]MCZ2257328.1 hypothetical protein [Sporosarcina sp. G11-34]
MSESNKFARLDSEQLQEINELENKLGFTLVAYDTSATINSTTSEPPSS